MGVRWLVSQVLVLFGWLVSVRWLRVALILHITLLNSKYLPCSQTTDLTPTLPTNR